MTNGLDSMWNFLTVLFGLFCTWDNLFIFVFQILLPVMGISFALGALEYWLLKRGRDKKAVDGVPFIEIIPGLVAGKTYCKKGEEGIYYIELAPNLEYKGKILKNRVLRTVVVDDNEGVYTFFTEEDLTTNKWVEVKR